MPIPRSGRLWRLIFVALLVAVVGAYVWYARSEYPHGGSPIGLTYGILGSLLILLLGTERLLINTFEKQEPMLAYR